MDDIYNNIEEYNSNKKRKILIVFDDTIAYMLSTKKLNPRVTELFISDRKVNISKKGKHFSCFYYTKNIRLNSTHYFIMRIPNKREFKQISFSHSSDVEFKEFVNL